MELSQNKFKEIKSIIQKFIDDDAFDRLEEHVQTHYTVKILDLLGWPSDKTIINTPQIVKTGEKPDVLLRGDGGGTIFIIESKEPSKSLDGKYKNKTFVEQINQYCNSEGIYWGILTNFIEWRIYNSYRSEIYDDKGKLYRINTIVDKEINNDESLYFFFNKITYDNLNNCKGKIDISAIYYKKQEEIKNEFFDNLKLWRSKLRNYLYKNASKKNKEDLSEKCDYFTQKILDRMIFMEVCNDKGIISYDVLGSILYSKKNKYEELKVKFKDFDDKFNSELFAEDKELDKLKIDDEPMEEIIRGINKIDFSKLSPQIIGEVYENYLGELLKKSKEKIKVVETKQKAKRKEQGIYYTPDYIVNYIVENTLGEILKDCNTHEDIEKIRVLDPACGSGSFLIRAFDEFYNAYERCRKEYGLFDEFKIKKKILLYNLYGVDLDERAVEIAKLNLLIKALEGTSDSSLEGKRKLLPNLNLNIRCGNSLISGKSIKEIKESDPDIIDKDILTLIELKDKFRNAVEDKNILLENIYIFEEKINSKLNTDLSNYFSDLDNIKPFNYEISFCEIFKDGGFDCVIGNPPYITLSLGKRQKYVNKSEIKYYNNEYTEVIEYKGNTFTLFTYNSINITKFNGLISMIVPNTMLLNFTFKKLRQYVLRKCLIKYLINIKEKIFDQAEIGGNLIYIFTKNERNNNKDNNIYCIEIDNNSKDTLNKPKYSIIKQNILNDIHGSKFYLNRNNINIINKINNISSNLDNYVIFYQGIITGDNKKYISNNKINCKYKEIIRGKDISRYILQFNGNYVYFDKKLLWSNTEEKYFKVKEKIINRQTGDSLVATIDTNQYYTLDSTHVQILKNNQYSLKYILGIFNSRLMDFIYKNYTQESGRTFAQVKIINLKRLPIRLINFDDINEKVLHDELVKLVDEMLKLNENPEKNITKIAAKDLEIDDLVYKLYGITKEEREIIESEQNL